MFSDLKVAVVLAQRRAAGSSGDVDDDAQPGPRTFPRPTRRDLKLIPWAGGEDDPLSDLLEGG